MAERVNPVTGQDVEPDLTAEELVSLEMEIRKSAGFRFPKYFLFQGAIQGGVNSKGVYITSAYAGAPSSLPTYILGNGLEGGDANVIGLNKIPWEVVRVESGGTGEEGDTGVQEEEGPPKHPVDIRPEWEEGDGGISDTEDDVSASTTRDSDAVTVTQEKDASTSTHDNNVSTTSSDAADQNLDNVENTENQALNPDITTRYVSKRSKLLYYICPGIEIQQGRDTSWCRDAKLTKRGFARSGWKLDLLDRNEQWKIKPLRRKYNNDVDYVYLNHYGGILAVEYKESKVTGYQGAVELAILQRLTERQVDFIVSAWVSRIVEELGTFEGKTLGKFLFSLLDRLCGFLIGRSGD